MRLITAKHRGTNADNIQGDERGNETRGVASVARGTMRVSSHDALSGAPKRFSEADKEKKTAVPRNAGCSPHFRRAGVLPAQRARARTGDRRWRANDAMSPLKDTQPSSGPTAAEAQTVKAPAAAENVATADLENVPTASSWTEIQKRAYHGSGIFDAAPAPAPAPRPDASAPSAPQPASVEEVAAEAAAAPPMAASADPSKMSLKDLRVACRERGLNPGGGKEQLCERLLESVRAGGSVPFAAPAGARDVAAGVKRGVKRDSESLSETLRAAKAAKTAAAEVFDRSETREKTVSDAKLRDIGVGADVFFVKGDDAMNVRSGAFETLEPPRAETEASKAKAREAKGHGDPFSADFDAKKNALNETNGSCAAEEHRKGRRPAGSTDLHVATHCVFGDVAKDKEVDPHEATRALVGSKHVSETLKRSLFEGSRLFDDDAETAAVETNRLKIRAKDEGESRVTASKHHEGHGIFSEAWVVPRDVEEGEAIDGDVPIEPADVEKKKRSPGAEKEGEEDDEDDAFRADDGFKPIGACSPCVDLRWKTEEEEEAEEAVAILVYDAIRRILDRASKEAFYAKTNEEGK